MPVYAITGQLGSGKTLVCVGKIRDAILRGCRVATNLDLRVELLCPTVARGQIIRLPDYPDAEHLSGLGIGNPSRDESRNGVLVLDEAGAWLNSRNWNDKNRHKVIEWMLHARKLGWDVFLIVQDVSLIDKQVRTAFVEHLVRCRRLDRFSVPFIGAALQMLGGAMRLPQVHIANVFYGSGPGAVCVERWIYRGRELWKCYETRQLFDPISGPSSFLTPRDYPWLRVPKCWHQEEAHGKSWWWKLREWFKGASAESHVYRAFRVAEEYGYTPIQTGFADWLRSSTGTASQS